MIVSKEQAERHAAFLKELYAADRKLLPDKRAEWRMKNGLPPIEKKAATNKIFGVGSSTSARSKLERMREWRKENPQAKRIENHNYKSKKRSTGRLSRNIVERLMKLQRGKCACCGKNLDKDYHVDHIVPISRGGKNIDANVQLLTSRCNMEKSNKDPLTFMQQRGFLI